MIPMKPTVWDYLFIVPDSYTRIFDFPYQVDVFNTYHKRALCRLFHAAFSVPSLFGWFLLFSYLDLGFVFLCLLSIYYLWMNLRIGLITLPIMALMWAAAGFTHRLAGAATFQWSVILITG